MPRLKDCIKKLGSIDNDIKDMLLSKIDTLLNVGYSNRDAEQQALRDVHDYLMNDYNDARKEAGLEPIRQAMKDARVDQLIGPRGIRARAQVDPNYSADTDISNLTRAMAMHSNGVPDELIKFHTGWEQEMGQWYMETDSPKLLSASSLYDMLVSDNEIEKKLSEVIDISEISKYYPKVNETKVKLVDDEKYKKAGGWFDPKTNTITINRLRFKEHIREKQPSKDIFIEATGGLRGVRRLFNHELAHVIQKEEGFAQGMDPYNKELIDEVNAQMQNNPPLTGHEMYRRSAGEIQAKGIQNRIELSAAEKRMTLLKHQEDIAPEDRIYLFNQVYGNQSSVSAWHGSPHRVDKFSTDKIGTGEGAASFGWGLYFTELETIADYYAETLTDRYRDEKAIEKFKKVQEEILPDDFEGDVDVALYAIDVLRSKVREEKFEEPAWLNGRKLTDGQLKEVDNIVSKYVNKLDKVTLAKKYKVTLHKGKNPGEYTWLEWDKPLSANTKKKILSNIELNKVRSGIGKDYYDVKFNKGSVSQISFPPSNEYLKDKTLNDIAEIEVGRVLDFSEGARLYKSLSNLLGGDKQASLFLLENGIDGIKYPAESIARGTTSDTARGFNYVVFDENAVEIEDVQEFSQSEDSLITEGAQENPALASVEATAKALEGKDAEVSNILVPNSSIKEKVYHGSENIIVGDFKKMNPNIEGFFFSSDIENAKTYGENIVEAYVDVKNPLVIDAKGLKFTDDIPVTVIASYPNQEPYETVIPLPIDEIVYMVKNGKRKNQLIEIKDREKYDGIVFKNLIDPALSSRRNVPQETIAVLENSQIKRVDNKSIAEAYHAAKADGSNPELVKAVEGLLSAPQPTNIKPQDLAYRKPTNDQVSATKITNSEDLYRNYGERTWVDEVDLFDNADLYVSGDSYALVDRQTNAVLKTNDFELASQFEPNMDAGIKDQSIEGRVPQFTTRLVNDDRLFGEITPEDILQTSESASDTDLIQKAALSVEEVWKGLQDKSPFDMTDGLINHALNLLDEISSQETRPRTNAGVRLQMFKILHTSNQIKVILDEGYDGDAMHKQFSDYINHTISALYSGAGALLSTANKEAEERAAAEIGISYNLLPPNLVSRLDRPAPNGGANPDGTPRTLAQEAEFITGEVGKLWEDAYVNGLRQQVQDLMAELDRVKRENAELKKNKQGGHGSGSTPTSTTKLDALMGRLEKGPSKKKSDQLRKSSIEFDERAKQKALSGLNKIKKGLSKIGFAYDPTRLDPDIEEGIKELWEAAVQAAKGRVLRAKAALIDFFDSAPELYQFGIPDEIWETYFNTDSGREFIQLERKDWAEKKFKEVTAPKGPTDPRDHFDDLFSRMRASKRPDVQQMIRSFQGDVQKLGEAFALNDAHVQLIREAITLMELELNALNLAGDEESLQRHADVQEKIDELLDFVEFLSGSRDPDVDLMGLDSATQLRRKRRAALAQGLATLGTTVDEIIKDWIKLGSTRKSLAQELATFMPPEMAIRIEKALMDELDAMMEEAIETKTSQENKRLVKSIQEKQKRLFELDQKAAEIKRLEEIIENTKGEEPIDRATRREAQRKLDILLGISSEAESNILNDPYLTDAQKKQALDELERERNLDKRQVAIENAQKEIDRLENIENRSKEQEEELEFHKNVFNMLNANAGLHDAKKAIEAMIKSEMEALAKERATQRQLAKIDKDIESIKATGKPVGTTKKPIGPVDPRVQQRKQELRILTLQKTLEALQNGTYETKKRITKQESDEIESLKQQIKDERKRLSGMKSAIASLSKTWDPVQIIRALKAGAISTPDFLMAVEQSLGAKVTPELHRAFVHLSLLVKHIYNQPNGKLHNGIAMQKALAMLRNIRSQMAAGPFKKLGYALLNQMYSFMLSHPMSAINSLYGSFKGHIQAVGELLFRFLNMKDYRMAMHMLLQFPATLADSLSYAYGNIVGGRGSMALNDYEQAMMSRDMFDRVSNETWSKILSDMTNKGFSPKVIGVAKIMFKLMRWPVKKAMDVFAATDAFTTHTFRTWNEKWDAYDKLKPIANDFNDLLALINDELGFKEEIISMANAEADSFGFTWARKREYVTKRIQELRDEHIADFVLVEHAEHVAKKALLIGSPEGTVGANAYSLLRKIDQNEEDLTLWNFAVSLLKNIILPFGRNLINFTTENLSQAIAWTSIVGPAVPKKLRPVLTPHYNNMKESQESLIKYYEALQEWKNETDPEKKKELANKLRSDESYQPGSVPIFKNGKIGKEIFTKRDLLKAAISSASIWALYFMLLDLLYEDDENEFGQKVKRPKNVRITGQGTGITFADRQARNYEPNSIQIKDENGNWRTVAKWPFLLQHPVFFWLGNTTDSYYRTNSAWGHVLDTFTSGAAYTMATAPISQNSQQGLQLLTQLISTMDPEIKRQMVGMDPWVKLGTNVLKQLSVPGVYVMSAQMYNYMTNQDIKMHEDPYINKLIQSILFMPLFDDVMAYGPMGETLKQEFPLRMFEWLIDKLSLDKFSDPELQEIKQKLSKADIAGIFKYAYVDGNIGDIRTNDLVVVGLPVDVQEEIRRGTAEKYGEIILDEFKFAKYDILGLKYDRDPGSVRKEVAKIFAGYFDRAKEYAENVALAKYLQGYITKFPSDENTASRKLSLKMAIKEVLRNQKYEGSPLIKDVLREEGIKFIDGEWLFEKSINKQKSPLEDAIELTK